MHYQNSPTAYNPVHQYNSEFLVSILEVLMQYGTSSRRGWSPEAIGFSTIKASNSLKPFIEVSINCISLSQVLTLYSTYS
jgi:hypothetical protein